MSNFLIFFCAFLPFFTRALSSTHSRASRHAVSPQWLTPNGIARPIYLNHTIITNPLPTTGSCSGCAFLLDEFEIGWGSVTTHTAATVIIGVHKASNATMTLSTVQGSNLPPQEGAYIAGTVITTIVGKTTYTMQILVLVNFISVLTNIFLAPLQHPASESTMYGRQMYLRSKTAQAASNV